MDWFDKLKESANANSELLKKLEESRGDIDMWRCEYNRQANIANGLREQLEYSLGDINKSEELFLRFFTPWRVGFISIKKARIAFDKAIEFALIEKEREIKELWREIYSLHDLCRARNSRQKTNNGGE